MSWLSRGQTTSSRTPLGTSSKTNEQQRAANDDAMQIDGIAPTFQSKPSIRYADEARTKILFECLVEAEPAPIVKWFHNSQQLQPNPRFRFNVDKQTERTYKTSLEISKVSVELAGTYTVKCENSYGETSAKISLNFDSEQSINNSQQNATASDRMFGIKPIFLERPIIKQSNDFKQVQFDCKISADPKPEIEWLHMGKPLDSQHPLRHKVETSLVATSGSSPANSTYLASLILKSVEPEQTGEYKCIASNKLGSSVASINLNLVQSKGPKLPDGRAPKFPVKPKISQAGQLLTIECLVEANPRPLITWYHDGKSIIKEDSSHSHLTWHMRGPLVSGSELAAYGLEEAPKREVYVVSLDIRQPKSTDSGTYRCNAVNELGESSANIALNFQQQQQTSKLESTRESQSSKVEQHEQQHEQQQQREASNEQQSGKTEMARRASELAKSRRESLGTSEAARAQARDLDEQAQAQMQVDELRGAAARLKRRSSSSAGSRRGSRDEQGAQLQGSAASSRRNSRLANAEADAAAVASEATDEAAKEQQSRRKRISVGDRGLGDENEQTSGDNNKSRTTTTTPRSRTSIGSNSNQDNHQINQDQDNGARESPLVAAQSQSQSQSLSQSQSDKTATATRQQQQQKEQEISNRNTLSQQDVSMGVAENNGAGEGALESLPPAKRTSSTSSTKRTVSVKKKRPPTLLAPEGAADGLLEPTSAQQQQDDSTTPDGAPRVKRVVKKRVSVKRDPASTLKDIAEDPRAPQHPQDQEASRRDSQSQSQAAQDSLRKTSVGSTTGSGTGNAPGSRSGSISAANSRSGSLSSNSLIESRKHSLGLPTVGSRDARIPSVSIEAPQAQLVPMVIEPPKSGASGARRGTYEGLRGTPEQQQQQEDAEDADELAARQRYLASRGVAGARESLSPSGSKLTLNTEGGSSRPSSPGAEPASGSVSPVQGRRGSILLVADEAERRPSIILVAQDNKLRPGEIADRRRKSSVDVRRASSIEIEAADRPSTPLKPCGSKPAIVDFQDNVSGLENHTAYLTFGIEGDPVPSLRFFKGDSEIYEGGRYSIVTDGDTNTVHFCIRKAKPMDEARYKVIATNSLGEDSANIQLFVSDESGMDFRAMLRHRQYAKWKKNQEDPNWGNLKGVEEERLTQIKEPKKPDSFIKPLQNVRCKQGRDLKVRFECVFSKSGVKAKWFRNNKEIFPNKKFHLNSTGDLHVLEIDVPYVDDSGKITCQCLDSKCSAMLEVDEPEPVYKFTKVLAKGYGQHLGRECVLECACNSHKAQVSWFKNDPSCSGQPLPVDSEKYSMEIDKFGKKLLRIRNCQFDDSATYTAKIMNTPKDDELTTTQVQISEKKYQIMKPLYSQRAVEDDKIVLECEVDEADAPVKWYRKDRETGKWKELKPEQLKSKQIVVEGKKRRLIIKKAKCQDEGEYKCCTNADETSAELFVEPSNKWRKKLVDVTCVEDDPLVLECELMERKPGQPLVWLRNGKEVGHQGGSQQTTADERVVFKSSEDKMTLTIEKARLSDAGDWTALYGQMKCACRVQVLPAEKPPQMRFPLQELVCEAGKQQVLEVPYTVAGTRRSPVEAKLLCNGQPVSKDKVEISVKDDKIIVKFKDPQRGDSSDQYEFVVENDKGKQAHKFKVQVQAPPGPPEGPLKISDVHKEGCTLKWERPLDDGGCPVAHYVVERQEVGSGRTTWQECGVTSTTELEVHDLSPKKEYKFRVRAVNKKGKSEPLVALKNIVAKDPYDPPSEPENLVVTNWDKDFVDLEWEKPMKDGGIPIEKYIIEAKSKFAPDWTQISEVAAGAGCKAHVTEQLKEGAQMQFRVRAANKAGPGEPSKATKPVIIKARFVKPYLHGDGLKNVVVKKGRPVRYEIAFNGEPAPEVTWYANGQLLRCITDKCEIEVGEKKTTIQVLNTTRADSGRYKIVLKNSSGECSSEADVVVLDRPSAPEGPLVIEEIKADQVTIKWRKPRDTGGEPIEGYVIEKMNEETGRWLPAGECGPNDETFTVSNLIKGKKYKFRVRAKNKEGESDALELANALDMGEEPTVTKCPSKVTVGQGQTARVKIHFNGDPSDFRIVNTDTGQVVGEAGDGSGGLDSEPKYTVFDDYLTVTIPNAQKNKHAGNYKVELKNKLGSVSTNFELDVTGPPGAPQGPLEASDATENSISLNWRPPADDGGSKVTHYVVERRDANQMGNDDAWIEVNANCKDTAFTVTGLTKDHKYEFRVMAVNENGQSKPLETDKPVQAKLPFDTPDAPGKPVAKPLTDDSIQLEWERPASDGGSRILGYLVEKREVGSDTWQKVNPQGSGASAGQPGAPSHLPPGLCTSTELVVPHLVENRKYEFRVMAVNAAGVSDPSDCSAAIEVVDPNATDAPKFLRPLRRTVGMENGTIELECVVKGSPAPEIVWCKGNRELRDTPGSKFCMTQEAGPEPGTTTFKLLIARASADDADEYSIKATNRAGSRTSRCDVEVQVAPKIKPAPQYQQAVDKDSALAFARGESLQLKLAFTGNPPPTARWFRGDEEIEPGAKFDIETDDRHSVLTVRDATRDDSGLYRLVVSNKLGEDSCEMHVSVSDRPEPPRFPQVDEVADDSAKLTWRAPLWDGGSQVTQYVVEKRELPMTSWIRAGTTRFLSHEVMNLNEENDYEFRVFAENIYGRSEPSEVIKCTTTPSTGANKKRKGAGWALDADGNKIRSTYNEPVDDYDKYVKDGPAIHLAADIKTCPITDNYEILERIGLGVFGEVYRVKEKATGNYYAAKFTPTQSAEEKSLIKKEIDTINLLHHTNCLRLHDAYEDHDEMVTVHEFISGPELFEKIADPNYQMTEEQVRKYMRDICEAVRHMHDRNVIHLDLKPENFVMQSKNPLYDGHEPKVKIVDFGLACKLDPHEICKISTTAADYAAPEILERDTLGFYTDMWAIGVLTYVLLSGKTPFETPSDTKSGTWSFDDPVFDKVSPEGRDFIEKLLIKQKEKRMTAHECLEHPWLRDDGDEETRRKRREPLVNGSAYRRQKDAMKHRYFDWWDKSILSIGHISNYGPLRKLHADRYKIQDFFLDRRELAPRFVIKPHSTFAYEGQSAQFHCLISSNSPITISWFKDNKELRQSVKFMKRYAIGDNNYAFVVNRCKMNDMGEFIIRAENHHGGREEPVFLDVRKRPVDFTPVHLEPMRKKREPEPPKFEEEPDCPPRFNFRLRPRCIQSGMSVKLICCLKGKPTPTITWLKDNKELSKRDYTLKHSDGVVTLEIVSCDTSHTGKYTCRAENSLGEDETTADVLIQGRRTFTPTPIRGLVKYPDRPIPGSYSVTRSVSISRARFFGIRHLT